MLEDIEHRIQDVGQYRSENYSIKYWQELSEVIKAGDENYDGIFRDKYGQYYGYHFITYAYFVGIVEKGVDWIHGNPLASFQITNTLLIIVALLYTVKTGSNTNDRKNHIVFVGVTSGVVFYLRWSHPEVFIFCCIFCGVTSLLANNLILSLLLIALAASQTISLGLILPFVGIYGLLNNKRHWEEINKKCVAVAILVSAMLTVSSAVFYWVLYGVPSLIASVPGMIDYNLVTWSHLASMYVDLDQGLWIGSPWLFIVFVMSIVSAFRSKRSLEYIAELTITAAISVIIVAPMLSHYNVNSGASVFQRYALWATAPIAAYVAVRGNPRIGGRFWWLFKLAAVIWVLLWGGPVAPENQGQFKPWTTLLLNSVPSVYVGEPGVFYGRALFSEAWKVHGSQPAAFVDSLGLINKILIPSLNRFPNSLQQICDGELRLGGSRVEVTDAARSAGYGWSYLSGPFECDGAITHMPVEWPAGPIGTGSTVITLGSASKPSFVSRISGFSSSDQWGSRWTVSHVSSVVLEDEFSAIRGAVIYAYPYDKYSNKKVYITCNRIVNEMRVSDMHSGVAQVRCGPKLSGQRQYIQFILPGAVSPVRWFFPSTSSSDSRLLGLAVQRIVLQIAD